MKTLSISTNSIKVQLDEHQTMVVARYDDENGPYFLNEMLEKQYAVIESIPNTVEPTPIIIDENDTPGEWRFYVDAWKGDQPKSYTKTVKASNFEYACRVIERSYKNILDYSLDRKI